MSTELLVTLLSEHGPWVVLVFYLLWRDVQKDAATRSALDRNATVLTEIATIIRERLPHGYGGRP